MNRWAKAVDFKMDQALRTAFDPHKETKLRHPMRSILPITFPLEFFHLAQILHDIFNPPRQDWSTRSTTISGRLIYELTLRLSPYDALIQLTFKFNSNAVDVDVDATFVLNGKVKEVTALDTPLGDASGVVGWLSMVKTQLDETTSSPKLDLVIAQMAQQTSTTLAGLVGPGMKDLINQFKRP